MDSLREVLAAAVFVVLAALFLRMIILNVRSMILKSRTPVENVTAEIIKKHSDTANDVKKGADVYSVLFRTEDGKELNFEVSKIEYDRISEGDTGHLSYRGNRFLEFEKDLLLKENEFNEKTRT